MWLLRRKTASSETSGGMLPPSTSPMRRIEITVERQTVTRLSRGSGSVPEETVEPQPGLPNTGERR
jgi:hypothetical protein